MHCFLSSSTLFCRGTLSYLYYKAVVRIRMKFCTCEVLCEMEGSIQICGVGSVIVITITQGQVKRKSGSPGLVTLSNISPWYCRH